MISAISKAFAKSIIKRSIGGSPLTTDPQSPLARLAAIYDPLALCYGLSQLESLSPQEFSATRALLADTAPHVDITALLAALQACGATNDQAVLDIVCPAAEAAGLFDDDPVFG